MVLAVIPAPIWRDRPGRVAVDVVERARPRQCRQYLVVELALRRRVHLRQQALLLQRAEQAAVLEADRQAPHGAAPLQLLLLRQLPQAGAGAALLTPSNSSALFLIPARKWPTNTGLTRS